MKNNAFRQANVTFFEAYNTHFAPNKSTPTRGRRRGGKEVSGTWSPYSTLRRRGAGRAWRVCMRRWKVSTLSARRRTPAARPTRRQPEESEGRLPGWMRMPARPGTPSKRGRRALHTFDHGRGERRKRGEGTSRRRVYSPAGMAGYAPDIGGSRVATERKPTSVGNKRMPSVPPGRIAVRQRRSNEDMGL